jgi:hypothetical protein
MSLIYLEQPEFSIFFHFFMGKLQTEFSFNIFIIIKVEKLALPKVHIFIKGQFFQMDEFTFFDQMQF